MTKHHTRNKNLHGGICRHALQGQQPNECILSLQTCITLHESNLQCTYTTMSKGSFVHPPPHISHVHNHKVTIANCFSKYGQDVVQCYKVWYARIEKLK